MEFKTFCFKGNILTLCYRNKSFSSKQMMKKEFTFMNLVHVRHSIGTVRERMGLIQASGEYFIAFPHQHILRITTDLH